MPRPTKELKCDRCGKTFLWDIQIDSPWRTADSEDYGYNIICPDDACGLAGKTCNDQFYAAIYVNYGLALCPACLVKCIGIAVATMYGELEE